MEKEQFDVKIVGIIFDPAKRKILIGRKEGEDKLSFLETPLSYEEEMDKCLKRMTEKKTGYVIHNLGTIYAENKLSSRKDKIKIHFLCEATEGEEKPGENVAELIWVKPTEIEEKLGVTLPSRLKEYLLNLA